MLLVRARPADRGMQAPLFKNVDKSLQRLQKGL